MCCAWLCVVVCVRAGRYISMQVLPVVNRLVEPIQTTSAFHIAKFLGLESRAYRIPLNYPPPATNTKQLNFDSSNEEAFKVCLQSSILSFELGMCMLSFELGMCILCCLACVYCVAWHVYIVF